jgi:hypothetical protein
VATYYDVCACVTLWGLPRAAYQHNPQALAHFIGHSNPKVLVTTKNVFPVLGLNMSPCSLFSCQNFIVKQRKKKNLVYQNQGWEPIHQKYEANENTSRHNPKRKKANNQQKSSKDPMQRRLMATK